MNKQNKDVYDDLSKVADDKVIGKVGKGNRSQILQGSNNTFERLFGKVKDRSMQGIDQVKGLPDKASRGVDGYIETLIANVKVKETLVDLLNEEITKEELVFALAQDDSMRRAMDKVTEGMINPEPIKVLDRSPVAFDTAHGISVFWSELNAPIEEKIDLAVNAKAINDQVEEGMNPNNSPTARRKILGDLGIEGPQMNELVTQEDDARYQKKVVDHYRNEHMERLGLKDNDILDPADEELLDNLVEDSIAMPDGFRIDIVREAPVNENLINPYEEAFGMSAEEFISTYALDDGYSRYDYPPYDELHNVDEYPSMNHALEEYERLHGVTLEDNVKELEEIQKIQKVMNQTQLDDSDLVDLGQPAQQYDERQASPEQPYDDRQAPTENHTPIVPPELSDDDLRTLEDWDNFQMY